MSTNEPNPQTPAPERMTVSEGVGALLVIGGGVVVVFAAIDPHEPTTVLSGGIALLLVGIALLWLARGRSVE